MFSLAAGAVACVCDMLLWVWMRFFACISQFFGHLKSIHSYFIHHIDEYQYYKFAGNGC